ncbi:MAG: hypothetical protein WA129_11595 [Acidovorax sp.]
MLHKCGKRQSLLPGTAASTEIVHQDARSWRGGLRGSLGTGEKAIALLLPPKQGQGQGYKAVNHRFQEAVGLGASIAKMGPSEDRFCRICSPIARLWGKNDDGKKWTAAVHLQPTISKSDRLLG